MRPELASKTRPNRWSPSHHLVGLKMVWEPPPNRSRSKADDKMTIGT